MAVAVVVVVTIAVLATLAFVPRTVAEGGQGADSWRLQVAPGILTPSMRLEGADETVRAPLSGSPSLDQTVVWQRPSGVGVDTIVAGPTPRGARSIRVTSVERGVGEAVVHRVLWRRIHVAVIDEPVAVTDLVAIGRDGEVLGVATGVVPTEDRPGASASPG